MLFTTHDLKFRFYTAVNQSKEKSKAKNLHITKMTREMHDNTSVGGLLHNRNNIQDQGQNMKNHRDTQINQTKE